MLSSEVHISLTRNYFFRSLPTLFPDIDRLIVLSDFTSGEVSGLEMVRENNKYKEKELYGENLKNPVVPEKEHTTFFWCCKDDLPFLEKQPDNGHINLFSELEHIILTLKITVNVVEGEIIDNFYIFFREDQSNFGVSRLDSVFDTTRKALIGSMLSKFISFFYAYSNSEQAKFIEFTNVTKQLLHQYNQSDTNTLLLEMMRQWSEDFLENFPRPIGINLSLSEQSLAILAKQNFKTAHKMLEKAASYALMLNSDHKQNEIEIVSAYLLPEINEPEIEQPQIKEVTILGKKYKVMKKLDDLEITAKILFDKGEDLTGTAVGKSMDIPVSAPAITDYLRKNTRYIGILFNEYPEKWQTIRNHFRPLVNVMEKLRTVKKVV